MAEDKDNKKEVEVKETEDKGSEERSTGRSEGEALAYLLQCEQYAANIYH